MKRANKYEVMDRASMQLHMLQCALADHAGLTKKTRKALSEATDALYKLYNAAATEYFKEKK